MAATTKVNGLSKNSMVLVTTDGKMAKSTAENIISIRSMAMVNTLCKMDVLMRGGGLMVVNTDSEYSISKVKFLSKNLLDNTGE